MPSTHLGKLVEESELLGITSNGFGQSGGEGAFKEEGEKGHVLQQHLARIHHGKTSLQENSMEKHTMTQALQVCKEFLKLEGSANSRVLNIPQSRLGFVQAGYK